MFCTRCGSEIVDGSIFCHNCGTEIKKHAQEESSVELVQTNEPNIEKETEKQVAEEVKTNDADIPLNAELPQLIIKNETKKNTGMIFAFIGLIGILIGIIIFLVFIQNKNDSEDSNDKNNIVSETSEKESLDKDNNEKEGDEEASKGEQVNETEEMKFSKVINDLNTSTSSIDKISIYDEKLVPNARGANFRWDSTIFYSLEEISPDSYEDGMINFYTIEKKQLYNADSNNLMEYEIYRNPNTNAVNKIVSIEYKGDILEITDYYYTDQGKVNFIFRREDINYVPSYATPDKSGNRYYFCEDSMIKWRLVSGGVQTNFVANKEETGRGGNGGTVTLFADLSEGKKQTYNEVEKRELNAAYNTYNDVINAKGISSIVGYVLDQDGQPLSEAIIHLYSEEYTGEIYSCKTNSEGKYVVVIPSEERNYRIEVNKDGYSSTILYSINQNTQLIGVYQETICLVKTSFNTLYDTQFLISDAFNKSYGNSGMMKIESATINIRSGINNKTGEMCGNAVTNADGIAFYKLMPGMYTIEVIKSGYAVTYYNIRVVKNGAVIPISTSPNLYEGEVRVVLTWDGIPPDLDSHLFTPFDSRSGDTTYHIWFGNRYDDNGNNLDVDDTDGYGPETMTINNLGTGLYKYYVADYSECSTGDIASTNMSYSNAKVDIYTSDGLAGTFYVPTNRPGVIWEVFEIRNKTIIPLQRYYSNLDNKAWWNSEK